VFTARYALSSYIKQQSFVFKGLMQSWTKIYAVISPVYFYIFVYVIFCVYAQIFPKKCRSHLEIRHQDGDVKQVSY
jgi:hypothetical protein